MGRLMRWLGAAALATGIGLAGAGQSAAFDGFGASEADSTYGVEIRFGVDLPGGAPDELELLLRTPGSTGAFVIPVDADQDSAEYVWDTSVDHVTPNTLITYEWRATVGDEVVTSEAATVRYEDDRPGLDWQRAALGDATVHWYGGAEAQAMRFGELTALGVARAEELLGTRLAGPVDVFVYETEADFFGALGPGAREWTGAAAYSELRTIFMWLGNQATAYLETAMVHEVAHVVFFDATDNPYHEPARWLNEGIATWLEAREASRERAIVEEEASAGGLFAFQAITEQFPIGERGAHLSYAQGVTMIDMIIDRHGAEAIAALTAAYREGASDDEALEVATGVPAEELYAAYYAEFGVDPPVPVPANPIAASNVDRPASGETDPGGVEGRPDVPAEPAPGEDGSAGQDDDALPLILVLAAAGVLVITAAVAVSRRAARGSTL